MTAGLVTASSLVATAAETQLPLPDVTVMAPGPANAPPYLRDPSNSYGRNPYLGRLRVEEDKFARVPCSDTRIAAISGGSCLQGYKFDIGSNASQSPAARGSCDLALDVTMFENARLTAEAAVLIFDPYKVTALGNTSSRCHVSGFLGYGVVDFVDM
ncbi:MAG TPA: hypothetical protein VM782_18775, partial [Stellaceae bacterium]|nr:hypothetical protein [Stellaceae bacterium]